MDLNIENDLENITDINILNDKVNKYNADNLTWYDIFNILLKYLKILHNITENNFFINSAPIKYSNEPFYELFTLINSILRYTKQDYLNVSKNEYNIINTYRTLYNFQILADKNKDINTILNENENETVKSIKKLRQKILGFNLILNYILGNNLNIGTFILYNKKFDYYHQLYNMLIYVFNTSPSENIINNIITNIKYPISKYMDEYGLKIDSIIIKNREIPELTTDQLNNYKKIRQEQFSIYNLNLSNNYQKLYNILEYKLTNLPKKTNFIDLYIENITNNENDYGYKNKISQLLSINQNLLTPLQLENYNKNTNQKYEQTLNIFEKFWKLILCLLYKIFKDWKTICF
jgi:hypothetical protein